MKLQSRTSLANVAYKGYKDGSHIGRTLICAMIVLESEHELLHSLGTSFATLSSSLEWAVRNLKCVAFLVTYFHCNSGGLQLWSCLQ